MTSLLDVWRAVDPASRLVSGATERLNVPVRGVVRTRTAPPHLPDISPGQVLLVDATVLPSGGIERFVAALNESGAEPAGVWVVAASPPPLEHAGDPIPVLVGAGSTTGHERSVSAYLDDEPERLARIATELRLAAAEAALADPQPSAPAGVMAAHLRRGVAVSAGGSLTSLNPRPAGRALATAFAALHARLLAGSQASPVNARRTRDGLWLVGRPIAEGSTVWLFDDLPFARVDEVALEALVATLRALMRRPPVGPARARRQHRAPPSSGDVRIDTLLAVARANGRIAPAARALGVHRNTVLYRLRRAETELGIDPRRPEDALRLLRERGPGD